MPSLYGVEAAGLPGINIDQNYRSVVDADAIKYYGTKPLTIFVVDFGDDASDEVGYGQALGEVIRVIQKYCTIVIRGNLVDDEKMTFFVEINNDEIDWNKDSTETTLVDQIEADIIDLGDDDWDYTAVTCTVVESIDINFPI